MREGGDSAATTASAVTSRPAGPLDECAVEAVVNAGAAIAGPWSGSPAPSVEGRVQTQIHTRELELHEAMSPKTESLKDTAVTVSHCFHYRAAAATMPVE